MAADVSNGTCYYQAGKQADSRYIPTGNTVDGDHYFCCQSGDKFNNHNVCVNAVAGRGKREVLLGLTSTDLDV